MSVVCISTHMKEQETLCPDTHQQRAIDGLLAQVYYEFLQSHRLVVYANEEVT
jgi:hypothetical protein